MAAGHYSAAMSGGTGFERLDAAPVQEMVVQLEKRIATRFPERGLRKVAADLVQMADEVADNALETQRRLRLVQAIARGAIVVIVLATVVVLAGRAEGRRPGTTSWRRSSGCR